MNIASARQLAINQIPTEKKSEKDSFIAYVFDVILSQYIINGITYLSCYPGGNV